MGTSWKDTDAVQLNVYFPRHPFPRLIVGTLPFCLTVVGQMCREGGWEVRAITRRTWDADFAGDVPGEAWDVVVG